MITAIKRDSDNRIFAFNDAGHGHTERNESGFSTVELPDQDVDQHYETVTIDDVQDERLKEIYYPDDVLTWDDCPNQRKPQILQELEAIDAEYHSDRSWREHVLTNSADFPDTRVQHFQEAEDKANTLRKEYRSL